MSSVTRRPKWHPTPPPPSPKILNLPRRTSRRKPRYAAAKPPAVAAERGRLEALFDEERRFGRSSGFPVVVLNSGDGGGGGGGEGRERVDNEMWRFQTEILRAECNSLRMEREFAMKKLQRNRLQMETTLRSALHTLGKKKMYQEPNVDPVVLAGEIEEKVEELQRSTGNSDSEVETSSNFDENALLLQQQLEKLGGLSRERCLEEDMAEASFSIKSKHKLEDSDQKSIYNKLIDMEVLRRKMEGQSKGILARMEDEYKPPMLSSSISNRTEQSHQEHKKEPIFNDDKKWSGCRCKTIVTRIMEQVRAESEQWSQMQEMLGQVREEMDQLKSSRDFWQHRALHAYNQIQSESLPITVQGWKQKAIALQTKINELEREVYDLRGELDKFSKGQENYQEETMRTKEVVPISLGAQIAKEKRELVRHLKEKGKENHHPRNKGIKEEIFLIDRTRKTHIYSQGDVALKERSPLQNIGNSSSPKLRQNRKAIFPLHVPDP